MAKPSTKTPKPESAPKPSAGGDASPKRKRDMLLVHGVSQDSHGAAYHVLRAREDRVEAGVVRPVQEGRAVQGEVVKLSPREENSMLFDVDVQIPRGALNAPGNQRALNSETSGNKGPAQVASDPYRSNWDRIWNKRGPKKPVLN